MSKIFEWKPLDEKSKRISKACLEELHNPEDGEPTSPEYDELTDKIIDACEGHDLQIILNGLFDAYFRMMRYDLDSHKEKPLQALVDFFDERLASIILAHRTFEKHYLANL